MWRTKPIALFTQSDGGLLRTLGTGDLVLLGIGGIIGAGIFVLTGVAAATLAGPAVVMSFVIAGGWPSSACMRDIVVDESKSCPRYHYRDRHRPHAAAVPAE